MDRATNGLPVPLRSQPPNSLPILDPSDLERHALEMLHDSPQTVYTLTELLAMNVSEIPCLVPGLFPKVGLAALVGSSDVGKSTLLRQLALCVIGYSRDFLGFELNVTHQSAIYVSTEDDEIATSFLASRQVNRDLDTLPNTERLRFVFDTCEVIEQLETLLAEQPADLVVIDCLADLYGDDMNQAGKVRGFLNSFSKLAQNHKCLFVFLHHTGKGKEADVPSKNNAVGSHAFEAKMRMVVELRKDLDDPEKKHFCIVKGNYLPESSKRESLVLERERDHWFRPTGERTAFALLGRSSKESERSEKSKRIIEMRDQGKTYEEIEKALGVSKKTIAKVLKQSVSMETEGNQPETEAVSGSQLLEGETGNRSQQ